MTSILELTADVMGKSKQLLTLAQESNWDAFTDLEAERQTLLTRFDLENVSMSEQENEHLYQQMNELLTLNEQLELVCTSQRSNIANELQKLRKGNKVAQAYSQ